MMASVPVRKQETSNVIQLSVMNGKLGVKPEVRYNKDGSVDKRHPNKKAGVSSKVYPLTAEEIHKMIDLFNKRIEETPNDSRLMFAKRNKMMFILGVNMGLRASDFCGLKWCNFYNEDGTFKESYSLIPKKTAKTRKFVEIFFNKSVKKAIEDYVADYPIEDYNDYLFKSRKGDGHLTEIALGRIVKEAAEEVGITKQVNSHSLRKSWSRAIYDRAEDKSAALVMLQECLRHSDSLTTLRYISIMDEEKKEAYESIELGLDWI